MYFVSSLISMQCTFDDTEIFSNVYDDVSDDTLTAAVCIQHRVTADAALFRSFPSVFDLIS